MSKISAVIITFNEEKNIANCINSLKETADEIIVLDSFSEDNTKQICENLNVRFIQHKFDGHIEQKNRAVSYASFDYVLSLDADEVLSEELQKSILHEKNKFNFDAYYLNRLNFFCGKKIKHCGWYPDKKIRLWNKNKANWGGNNPHDKVILNEKVSIGRLKGDLLHYSFHSIEQHIEQINKFSTIKAETYFKKGKKASRLKIIFKPCIKFLIQYFIKLGFLDGFYGFVICKNSAHSEFLKQVKLKKLWKNKNDR